MDSVKSIGGKFLHLPPISYNKHTNELRKEKIAQELHACIPVRYSIASAKSFLLPSGLYPIF